MQIDTTIMDHSLDVGPKASTGPPNFCGFSCCLPQSQHRSSKKILDTSRTTPITPSDDDDEIPQFYIDAVSRHDNAEDMQQQHQDMMTDNAFWKKLVSILWLLLAAKYWTGIGTADDGEKSLPPEINFEEEEEEFDINDEEEEPETLQTTE
jgi:hypothetical protein